VTFSQNKISLKLKAMRQTLENIFKAILHKIVAYYMPNNSKFRAVSKGVRQALLLLQIC